MCDTCSFIHYNEQETKKKPQKEKILLHDFFEKEINSIENWKLVGVETDMNSDHEFIHAVKKINLPSYVRIKIND